MDEVGKTKQASFPLSKFSNPFGRKKHDLGLIQKYDPPDSSTPKKKSQKGGSDKDGRLEKPEESTTNDLENLVESLHVGRSDKKPLLMNLDSLIEICSKKIILEPHDRKALFIRASTYLKKGLYFDALEDCNAIIKNKRDYAGAYFIRGCANEKLGELNLALQDYTTVLKLDPFHVNAVFARGACLNKMVVSSEDRANSRRLSRITTRPWRKTS